MVQPLLEAPGLPFREVLFADGPARKVFGQAFLDFRQGIEPVYERLAVVAVIEPLVKLVTDGPGQPGDFSISGFHNCVSSFGLSVRFT